MPSSEFDDDFQTVLVENTAQTVFNRLEHLNNVPDRYRHAWIWELLQNASDAADPLGVRVRVVVTNTTMEFSHTGKPFTNKNIGHLIYHGSTKQEDENAVGRYGTGFMTTHLISKRVRVEGQLEDGRRFDFELCREGETADALHNSMKASCEQFKASVRLALEAPPEYGTRYTYTVDDNVRSAVLTALENFRQHSPFVLAYNTRLQEVKIQLGDNCHTIAKGPATDVKNGFSRYPIVHTGIAKDQDGVSVLSSDTTRSVQVGLLLRKAENHWVIDIREDTPRLFLLFPLLGTERFSFPAVVNSAEFEPTDDRDGVFLWTSQEPKIRRNGALLEEAIELFVRLAGFAAKRKWERPDLLARVRPIEHQTWLGADEYTRLVRDRLLEPLRQCALVITMRGKYIPPLHARLPVPSINVSETDVWDCASQLRAFQGKIPRREDVSRWAQNLRDWAAIREVELTSYEEALTVESIAHAVAAFGSIEGLRPKLAEGSEPYTWLDSLLGLLHKAGLERVFEDHLPETRRIKLSLCKPTGTDTYCYSQEEVIAMLHHCQSRPDLHWLAAIILTLACTGLRIGELAALRWSDIDFRSQTILVADERFSRRRKRLGNARATKGRRERRLPIHPNLLAHLRSMKHHSDGRVFHGPLGGIVKPDTIRNILMREVITPLKERFATPAGEIGFEHGTVHSFRHYFCSQAFLSGAAAADIQEWLGHQDSKMVAHYRHLRDRDSQRKIGQIDFLGGEGRSERLIG